jgi:hypothetical protein
MFDLCDVCDVAMANWRVTIRCAYYYAKLRYAVLFMRSNFKYGFVRSRFYVCINTKSFDYTSSSLFSVYTSKYPWCLLFAQAAGRSE